MWNKIKRFFRDSETIFYARLQAFIGIVATVITFVEPSVLKPIMPAEWFPLLLVANGIATEVLRRLRTS